MPSNMTRGSVFLPASSPRDSGESQADWWDVWPQWWGAFNSARHSFCGRGKLGHMPLHGLLGSGSRVILVTVGRCKDAMRASHHPRMIPVLAIILPCLNRPIRSDPMFSSRVLITGFRLSSVPLHPRELTWNMVFYSRLWPTQPQPHAHPF